MGHFALNVHSIEIIDSVPTDESQTARHLYEHLLDLRSVEDNPQWDVTRHRVEASSDLFAVLDAFSKRATEEQLYPLLHFECHGSEEQIQLASGECITWLALSQSLRTLNRATRNNLIAVWAACEGFHSIKSIVGGIVQGTSMRLVVGPAEEVPAGRLEDSMKALYSALISAFDFDAAVQAAAAVEPSMHLYKAEDAFTQAYIEFFRIEALSQKSKRQQVEDWVTQAKQLPGLASIPKIHHLVKQALSMTTPENLFEHNKRNFFMLEEFPELKETLAYLTLDYVKEKVGA
jgi:hypothetical protein